MRRASPASRWSCPARCSAHAPPDGRDAPRSAPGLARFPPHHAERERDIAKLPGHAGREGQDIGRLDLGAVPPVQPLDREIVGQQDGDGAMGAGLSKATSTARRASASAV